MRILLFLQKNGVVLKENDADEVVLKVIFVQQD